MTHQDGEDCRVCDGHEWVCESHPDRPWGGMSLREDACDCGPGIPCGACNREMAAAGYVHKALEAFKATLT